jgi:hypothetical protein
VVATAMVVATVMVSSLDGKNQPFKLIKNKIGEGFPLLNKECYKIVL